MGNPRVTHDQESRVDAHHPPLLLLLRLGTLAVAGPAPPSAASALHPRLHHYLVAGLWDPTLLLLLRHLVFTPSSITTYY